MSNSSKNSLAINKFLVKKPQLVNYCESPLPGTPPPSRFPINGAEPREFQRAPKDQPNKDPSKSGLRLSFLSFSALLPTKQLFSRRLYVFLRWHVCRVDFARKIFFELGISLRKMLRNFPEFLCLCSAGRKKSRKIPAKFPTNFPRENSKKIHRRASAGAQGECIFAFE